MKPIIIEIIIPVLEITFHNLLVGMVHVSKKLTPGVQVVGAVVALKAASMDLLDVGQKAALPVVGPATVRTLFEDPHGGLQGSGDVRESASRSGSWDVRSRPLDQGR